MTMLLFFLIIAVFQGLCALFSIYDMISSRLKFHFDFILVIAIITIITNIFCKLGTFGAIEIFSVVVEEMDWISTVESKVVKVGSGMTCIIALRSKGHLYGPLRP